MGILVRLGFKLEKLINYLIFKFRHNIILNKNVTMNRKSQAALEFLTTYGWAFLVILIMIGALAYFGILSPSKVLPSRCNFGPEFQCIDYKINAANNDVILRLKNNVGDTATGSLAAISREDGSTYGCTINAQNTTISNWGASSVRDLNGSACVSTGWVAGTKTKVLVTMTYYTATSGASYTKQVQGEVYTTVT